MATKIQFHGEEIAFSKIGDRLTLLHGGAGPADHQGGKGPAAIRAIVEHTRNLQAHFKKNNPLPLSSLVSSERGLRSAEVTTLLGAHYLENDPLFNAGRGSTLQGDGKVRVSASYMESTRQAFSAVMNGMEILHPSELAFYLQFQKYRVLDPNGTQALAKTLQVPAEDLVTEDRRKKWQEMQKASQSGHTGTIGVVTLEKDGTLAAVTSTGGVGNETPGRVGDSPTVAGNFCDDRTAISCTGTGEEILSIGLAPKIATRVQDGMSLKIAVEKTLQEAAKKDFSLAVIAVSVDPKTKHASWAVAHTSPAMVWSAITPTGIRTVS